MMSAESSPKKQAEQQAQQPPVQSAEELVAMVESGPREPKNRIAVWLITVLCVAWSVFQLYIAYRPINAIYARAFHLAFAIVLVFLAYPAYKETQIPLWVRFLRRIMPRFGMKRSNRDYSPIYDILFALIAAVSVLYIWWDYENIIMRSGLPTELDVWMGAIMIVMLLEAARRALGPALAGRGSS